MILCIIHIIINNNTILLWDGDVSLVQSCGEEE